MTFRRQQIATLVLWGVMAFLADRFDAWRIFDAQHPDGPPLSGFGAFVLVGTYNLLMILFSFRFIGWLAWDSERGRRALRLTDWKTDYVLSEAWSAPAVRWFFHVDRKGNDLDA